LKKRFAPQRVRVNGMPRPAEVQRHEPLSDEQRAEERLEDTRLVEARAELPDVLSASPPVATALSVWTPARAILVPGCAREQWVLVRQEAYAPWPSQPEEQSEAQLAFLLLCEPARD